MIESSTSNSALTNSDHYSKWTEKGPACRQHLHTQFIVVRIRIRAHHMVPTGLQSAAITFGDITHHAVLLTYQCGICKGALFHRTADFASTGKDIRWGRYYKNIREFGDQKVGLPATLLTELYDGMDKTVYHLHSYNCQTWAEEFHKKVLNMNMVNMRWCPCDDSTPNIKQTATRIQRHRLLDQTFAVTVVVSRCTCGGVLYRTYRFSQRSCIASNGHFQTSTVIREDVIDTPLRNVESVYSNMPTQRYDPSSWNSEQWSIQFYRNVVRREN
ncbi:hypothetical protein niasHS_008049 [Heterodera schachtii]|uniref:PPPDE domain-containing protein n=1 Tax=Heterodera schachtii TaxID=97005 RepID=A0ABD2JC55_HETSC